MTHHWDEFSKSLAEPLPRRESLRRLGLVLAGTVLSPLGLQTSAGGHHRPRQQDPCKTFCQCRDKKHQDQCLKACYACGKVTSRLGGSCGNYFCCGARLATCVHYCADLANDPYNCGGCGNVCNEPGPYEEGACIDGQCEYACAEGAVYCDGTCTYLNSDPDNCGACGNVCPASNLACVEGICGELECGSGSTNCGGYCAFLEFDPNNCGACGFVCPGTGCADGECDFGVPSSEW